MGRVCRIAHWATLLGPSGPPARRWVTRTRPSGPEKARAAALPIPFFVICFATMAIPAKCGTDDLATLLGISVRRVTQLVEKKVLLREARGTFDVCDSVHRFIAHRETVVAQEHGVGAYGKARADVYVERARMMRLQREKLEGNLIPEEDAIEGWTRTLAVVKTQFLALPTKSAPYLVQLKTPAQAQNVLTPLVREILETIATAEILPDPNYRRRTAVLIRRVEGLERKPL